MKFLFGNPMSQRQNKAISTKIYGSKYWSWLKEHPTSIASLNKVLWRGAIPKVSFCLMLILSSAIATFGLLANSAATVIGAMIIAPLIQPTVGIAYSMVIANRRLLKQASFTAIIGIILTVITGFLVASLVGLRTLNPEIMARTDPTFLDLGIALGAGIAAGFAYTRQSVADTLPGTAIAVALVPPLCVVGIGFASWQMPLIKGASVLFLTSFVGIIFSGGMVFVLQGYGTIAKAQRGLGVTILALLFLALPLGYQMRHLLVSSNIRGDVEQLIRHEKVIFANKEIRRVKVASQRDSLLVELAIEAERNAISNQQIQEAQEFLSNQLDMPVTLRVKVVPIELFEVPADTNSQSNSP
ncbi:MAG: TIGR00341 family protein [Halothece sp.]